jgi:hypothetical protein
LLRKSQDE